MSYSISIPSGAVDNFDSRAEAAVEAYRKQLAVNDYQLGDGAEEQLKRTVAAATQLAQKLYGSSSVDVGATLSGHVNDGNALGTTLSLYLWTATKPASEQAPAASPNVGRSHQGS